MGSARELMEGGHGASIRRSPDSCQMTVVREPHHPVVDDLEPMKAVVTGGAGFIGQALVRQLRERDDEVVAVVRDPAQATVLTELGCTLVGADLARSPSDQLDRRARRRRRAVPPGRQLPVGIPESEHVAMFTANVVATRNVLDAAVQAGVHAHRVRSTVNVFGDTHGQVVDETYRRPQPPAFLSYYDETKYLAHLAAEERIAAGAPILIAMPGMVYGPGDHSQVGGVIRQAMAGTLTVLSAADLGGSLVHVDDVAAGLLLVHDQGRDRSRVRPGWRDRDAARRSSAGPPRSPAGNRRGSRPRRGCSRPSPRSAPSSVRSLGEPSPTWPKPSAHRTGSPTGHRARRRSASSATRLGTSRPASEPSSEAAAPKTTRHRTCERPIMRRPSRPKEDSPMTDSAWRTHPCRLGWLIAVAFVCRAW